MHCSIQDFQKLAAKVSVSRTPILFSDFKKTNTHGNVNVVSTFQVQDMPNPRGRPGQMPHFLLQFLSSKLHSQRIMLCSNNLIKLAPTA